MINWKKRTKGQEVESKELARTESDEPAIILLQLGPGQTTDTFAGAKLAYASPNFEALEIAVEDALTGWAVPPTGNGEIWIRNADQSLRSLVRPRRFVGGHIYKLGIEVDVRGRRNEY